MVNHTKSIYLITLGHWVLQLLSDAITGKTPFYFNHPYVDFCILISLIDQKGWHQSRAHVIRGNLNI